MLLNIAPEWKTCSVLLNIVQVDIDVYLSGLRTLVLLNLAHTLVNHT